VARFAIAGLKWLQVQKDQKPIQATSRLTVKLGKKRYGIDISVKAEELKPEPGKVIEMPKDPESK
jgi:hypothetical protein